MLSKLFRTPVARFFSGGHDPYWLHLEQKHDNYPQYAHLHWHTVDPLEIGKYAKYRSKEMYGDHVSEDPARIQWASEVGDYKELDREGRNDVYQQYLRFENDLIPFLRELDDPRIDGHHKLIDGVHETILSILKPKQVLAAKEFAEKLIKEYKDNGIRVTREAVDNKVRTFLLKSLSRHQEHELDDGLFCYLDAFGLGLPMGEE